MKFSTLLLVATAAVASAMPGQSCSQPNGCQNSQEGVTHPQQGNNPPPLPPQPKKPQDSQQGSPPKDVVYKPHSELHIEATMFRIGKTDEFSSLSFTYTKHRIYKRDCISLNFALGEPIQVFCAPARGQRKHQSGHHVTATCTVEGPRSTIDPYDEDNVFHCFVDDFKDNSSQTGVGEFSKFSVRRLDMEEEVIAGYTTYVADYV